MELETMLKNGAILRYRDPHGFYLVWKGKTFQCCKKEVESLAKRGRIRPNCKDQHGVYLFTYCG